MIRPALSSCLVASTLVLLAGSATMVAPSPAAAQPKAGLDEVNVIVPVARRPVWNQSATPVALQSMTAMVDIDEQTAVTQLELTLHNPAGRAREAQVLIPVPEGATIRSFQYDGTGPEPTAKLLPRDEARRIYDTIVASMRDPGLLEFAGSSVIRSSVFPIPAGATQKVRITFEQVIAADAGRLDYYLPRTESLASSGVAWTVQGSVKSKTPIASVYSPSHDLIAEKQGEKWTFKVTERGASNPGALRLSVLRRPDAPDGVAASVFAYPDASLGENSGYFLLLMNLPSAQVKAEDMTKREITLVIDRSGSMRGEKMDQAKAAGQSIVQGLRDGELLNIIDYSDSLSSFSPKPIIVDAKSRAEAAAYIKGLEANGGTNIRDALVEAVTPSPQAGTLPIVLFLTDGLATVGETRESAIREAVAKANGFNRRIFTFGVGYDVNSPLLSSIARATRGATTFVLPGENVETKVSQVFRRLNGPTLAEPTIVGLDAGGAVSTRIIRSTLPSNLPDVFEGDQIIIAGEYHGVTRLPLRLAGTVGGQAKQFDMALDLRDASARNAFVPRMWASRRMGGLIDQIRESTADNPRIDTTKDAKTKELVDEIVRLSTRWGIMTEYTSFIATEPKMDHLRALSTAVRNLEDRAADRAGAAGVNQESNAAAMQSPSPMSGRQVYFDKDMRKVEVATVQMIGNQTLFRRGQRWVDSRLPIREDDGADEVVQVGTARYQEVVDELSKQDLLGVLGLDGEVDMQIGGKRVRVQNSK